MSMHIRVKRHCSGGHGHGPPGVRPSFGGGGDFGQGKACRGGLGIPSGNSFGDPLSPLMIAGLVAGLVAGLIAGLVAGLIPGLVAGLGAIFPGMVLMSLGLDVRGPIFFVVLMSLGT